MGDMSAADDVFLPIACTLSAADGPTRMERWQRLHEEAQLGASRRGSGVEVTYRGGDDVAAELQELVEAERECCAFAAWQVHTRDSQLVLTIAARSAADEPAVAELAAAFGV